MATQHDPDLDRWLSVREVCLAEGVTPRQVYWAIDNGLKHSRIRTRIRLRRRDWHEWHEAHAVGGEAA